MNVSDWDYKNIDYFGKKLPFVSLFLGKVVKEKSHIPSHSLSKFTINRLFFDSYGRIREQSLMRR